MPYCNARVEDNNMPGYPGSGFSFLVAADQFEEYMHIESLTSCMFLRLV